MSTRLKTATACVVRQLENEEIQQNCVRLYKETVDWVYGPCDDNTICGLYHSTTDNGVAFKQMTSDQTERRLEQRESFDKTFNGLKDIKITCFTTSTDVRAKNISLIIVQGFEHVSNRI